MYEGFSHDDLPGPRFDPRFALAFRWAELLLERGLGTSVSRHPRRRRGWLQPAHGPGRGWHARRRQGLRAEVIDPKIAEHKGRIFKATGDGVLAEFPSVVNAVACAVDIQRDVRRETGPARGPSDPAPNRSQSWRRDCRGRGHLRRRSQLAARLEGLAAPVEW